MYNQRIQSSASRNEDLPPKHGLIQGCAGMEKRHTPSNQNYRQELAKLGGWRLSLACYSQPYSCICGSRCGTLRAASLVACTPWMQGEPRGVWVRIPYYTDTFIEEGWLLVRAFCDPEPGKPTSGEAGSGASSQSQIQEPRAGRKCQRRVRYVLGRRSE